MAKPAQNWLCHSGIYNWPNLNPDPSEIECSEERDFPENTRTAESGEEREKVRYFGPENFSSGEKQMTIKRLDVKSRTGEGRSAWLIYN